MALSRLNYRLMCQQFKKDRFKKSDMTRGKVFLILRFMPDHFREMFTITQLESFSCFQLYTSTFFFLYRIPINQFTCCGSQICYRRLIIFNLRVFEMFRKSNFIFIFYFLVQSTGSANVKPQNSSVKSVLSNSHGPPRSADQTFNINNWGLGNIERKLLMDIKAKIDSLSNKGNSI